MLTSRVGVFEGQLTKLIKFVEKLSEQSTNSTSKLTLDQQGVANNLTDVMGFVKSTFSMVQDLREGERDRLRARSGRSLDLDSPHSPRRHQLKKSSSVLGSSDGLRSQVPRKGSHHASSSMTLLAKELALSVPQEPQQQSSHPTHHHQHQHHQHHQQQLQQPVPLPSPQQDQLQQDPLNLSLNVSAVYTEDLTEGDEDAESKADGNDKGSVSDHSSVGGKSATSGTSGTSERRPGSGGPFPRANINLLQGFNFGMGKGSPTKDSPDRGKRR